MEISWGKVEGAAETPQVSLGILYPRPGVVRDVTVAPGLGSPPTMVGDVASRSPAPSRDWWPYVVIVFVVLQIALGAVPRLWPGKAGMVCWYIGSERIFWWGPAVVLLAYALIRSAWRRPFWNRRRAGGYAMIAVLALSPLTYRSYPSSHAGSPSRVRFRVPMDGLVTVGWGGDTPDVNYHVIAPDQRWAYDLLITVDGSTHRGEGREWADYYVYDRPVLAPADGTVRAAVDRDPDMPIGQLGGGSAPTGNHIVLDVAPGEFLYLCHLKPGSLRVRRGDTVTRGQEIARVGNSGNTSEPHLHIHLQDAPDRVIAEGIPLRFHGYRSGGRLVDSGMPRGGFTGEHITGEIIEHAGDVAAAPPSR